MTPQQYKLRLSEGTLLVVDHDGLSTWLVDGRAMVQPVGSQRWHSLRQFLADERAGLSPGDDTSPRRRTTAAARPRPVAKSRGVLGILSGWVNKVAPASDSSRMEVQRDARLRQPAGDLRALADALTPPPPRTAEPAWTGAGSYGNVVAEPSPAAFADEVSVTISADEPFEPSPVLSPEMPAAETSSLRTIAEDALSEEAPEVWVEPDVPARTIAPDDDDLPTVPRIQIEDTYHRSRRAAAAPAPVVEPVVAPEEPPDPPSVPLNMWMNTDEPAVPRAQSFAFPAVAAPTVAPTRLRKMSSPRPIVQALADEPAPAPASIRRGSTPDDDLPILALKPLAEDSAAEPATMYGGEHQLTFLEELSKPQESAFERALQTVSGSLALLKGWMDTLMASTSSRSSTFETSAPLPSAVSDPPERVLPLADDPWRPAASALEVPSVEAGPGWLERMRDAASGPMDMVAGWVGSLTRPATSSSLSLYSDARETPSPSVREEIPARPVVPPPPPLHELPVLRLAPLPAATEWLDEDVYDGDIYDGPGFLDSAWLFVKRMVFFTGLVAATLVAAATWETWLPNAGYFGTAVVGEIEKHTQMPGPRPATPAEEEAQRRKAALATATQQLPYLAPESVQLVMSSNSLSGLLEPPEVFRRACDAAERGTAALTPEEAQELEAIRGTLFAALGPFEQERTQRYEHLRSLRATLPFDDREMLEIYVRGTHSLSPESRDRLRALQGKAIAAALAPPTSPAAETVIASSRAGS